MPRSTNKATPGSQKPASVAASARPPRAAKTNAYSSAGWAPAKKTRKRTISESNSNGPLRNAKKGSPPEPRSISTAAPTQQSGLRRKPPAAISIDDDSSDDQSQKPTNPSSSKPSHNQAPVEDDSESSTDDDDDDGADLSESQEETDLMHLDKDDLREKLSSERPQWNARSQRRADDEGLEDQDEPLADHEQGTTASESDGALEVDEREEETTMDIADDELESEPERRSKKNKPSVSAKREKARLAEVPRWKTKDIVAHWRSKHHANIHRKANSTLAASDPEEDSDHDNDRTSEHHVNTDWPEEAHYTPVAPGARNLSIKDQPLPMRRTIRASVNHVTGHFLFESAYPAANQAEFETFHRDVFVQCAKRLGYREINKRLKEDYELVKLCARVINARISHLRTQSKGITDKKVEGFYQLVTGIEAEKRVKELTNEDQNYIYPVVLGNVDTNRPYYHPCIISSIKEAFFTGSRGTLSQKYQARFGSTIVEGPKKDEMELPIAMVCVIATSTHASLDDWSQGYKRTKSDFRADAYESIYRGHEIFLTTLRVERPDFFHILMSGLYDSVGSQGIRSASHIATRCMARLNLPPLDD